MQGLLLGQGVNIDRKSIELTSIFATTKRNNNNIRCRLDRDSLSIFVRVSSSVGSNIKDTFFDTQALISLVGIMINKLLQENVSLEYVHQIHNLPFH